MKLIKKTAGIILGSLFISLSTVPVLAQSIYPKPPAGVPTTPLIDMITKISSVILLLVGGIAVLFLIIGGFQYITASGNEQGIARAKMTIMYSIIGIGVCLLSYTIIYFVIKNLT